MVVMRLTPLVALSACLVVTGCAASGGASAATHTPRPSLQARVSSPAATPAPTAAPTPAAQRTDVAGRPECGVPDGTVPATGKVIVISLACQELTAYQDGVPFLSTPVTTGEPALPTPTGQYSVIRTNSPFEMVSSWPYGTVGWYAPSWVQWVLWFRSDGYGIHDASWRSAYGPGTEAHGSHGCVNVPHAAMQHLYPWGSVGTAVDIL
jgi:lipoprotein-anchoring transpeptidase ErfK/SrfK